MTLGRRFLGEIGSRVENLPLYRESIPSTEPTEISLISCPSYPTGLGLGRYQTASLSVLDPTRCPVTCVSEQDCGFGVESFRTHRVLDTQTLTGVDTPVRNTSESPGTGTLWFPVGRSCDFG